MSEFKKRLTDPGKPKRADTIEQVRLIQAENERRLSVAAKPTPKKK